MFPTILSIRAAYLIGAIPFGYLVARLRGVDIFAHGSGNIGATNVGRALGRRFGVLVFALDFAKGALSVALAIWLRLGDRIEVAAALAAFLGHLFPIYLKFRGGKGVATGAGAVFVLLPIPALAGLVVWIVTLSSRRAFTRVARFCWPPSLSWSPPICGNRRGTGPIRARASA